MSERAGPELPRLPPAYRLVARESVDSTNAEAWRLAEQGAEDGTLVWAREQRQGRGRRGRGWVGAPGNLFFSLVLRPDCGVHEAAQLSFLAALALGEAIGSVAPPMIEVRYKWPNDVLLNGRKAAGILLEAKVGDDVLEWLILGIGVNVVSHPGDVEPPATSLHFEGCPSDVTAVSLLEAFAPHFMAWVNRWLDDGFAPVRQAWLNHARGLGEEIRVSLAKESLAGRFKDLDADGALVLELPDGRTKAIAAGEVYFVD